MSDWSAVFTVTWALSACAAGLPSAEYDEVLALAARTPASEPAARREPAAPAGEDDLAREARLDSIIALALSRNPELAELQERIRGGVERARAEGRLPDLELRYEQWGVPLLKPYAVHDAEMLMLGVEQAFPAPGTLGARARAALEDARMSGASLEARRADIVQKARRAYYDYYRADRELAIHAEHLELARLSYQAGRRTQEDVLRFAVEVTRLENEIVGVEQERAATRLLLNALMAREPDAALGPPVELASAPAPALPELERRLAAGRPELVGGERAVRRSRALLEIARLEARRPSFMLGGYYMLQPMAETLNAYMLMGSITLPWLSPRHEDEVRAAERALAADLRALESTRNVARYELHEAATRWQSTSRSLVRIDEALLPQARQSLDAAQAAFIAGQSQAVSLLDALRSLLQVRLERVREVARLEQSRADMERAAGVSWGRPVADSQGVER